MVSFFRDRSSAGVFWILALSILLHARFFVFPPVVIIEEGSGFLSTVLESLKNLPPLALTFLYHLLVIIQALRLNYALDDLRMFQKHSLTTAMCYILLTALYPQWSNISSALIANSMIIWLIYKLARLYNSQEPKSLIYNIGLITGVTVMLYSPAVSLVLLMFWALGILRPFRANEWFILLLGIITPFYFLAAILFLNDRLGELQKYLPRFYPHVLNNANKITITTTSIVAGIVVLTGFSLWQANTGRIMIQARKNWAVILLMLIFLIPMVFLSNGAQFNYILFCAVPAAALAANAFVYPKKNILPAVLFWCLVAVVIYNNWYAIKN